MYSPLDTIRVGTGDQNGAFSAGATCRICSSLSHESSSRLSGGRLVDDHIPMTPAQARSHSQARPCLSYLLGCCSPGATAGSSRSGADLLLAHATGDPVT